MTPRRMHIRRSSARNKRKWEKLKIKLSLLTQGRTTRRRRTTITTRRRTRNKRSLENILPTFNATLVMKRGTLQETIPRTRNLSIIGRDIMLTLPKTMNELTKDLYICW